MAVVSLEVPWCEFCVEFRFLEMSILWLSKLLHQSSKIDSIVSSDCLSADFLFQSSWLRDFFPTLQLTSRCQFWSYSSSFNSYNLSRRRFSSAAFLPVFPRFFLAGNQSWCFDVLVGRKWLVSWRTMSKLVPLPLGVKTKIAVSTHFMILPCSEVKKATLGNCILPEGRRFYSCVGQKW